jgi:hypothetical protein
MADGLKKKLISLFRIILEMLSLELSNIPYKKVDHIVQLSNTKY